MHSLAFQSSGSTLKQAVLLQCTLSILSSALNWHPQSQATSHLPEDVQSILFETSSVHDQFSSEPHTHRRDSSFVHDVTANLTSFSTSTVHSFKPYSKTVFQSSRFIPLHRSCWLCSFKRNLVVYYSLTTSMYCIYMPLNANPRTGKEAVVHDLLCLFWRDLRLYHNK